MIMKSAANSVACTTAKISASRARRVTEAVNSAPCTPISAALIA